MSDTRARLIGIAILAVAVALICDIASLNAKAERWAQDQSLFNREYDIITKFFYRETADG